MSRVCRQMDSFLSISVANGRMDRSDVYQILTRKRGFLSMETNKGYLILFLEGDGSTSVQNTLVLIFLAVKMKG